MRKLFRKPGSKKAFLFRRTVFIALLIICVSNALYSQCPVINGAMVNSCAGGAGEGANEFIVFTTTTSDPVSAYQLYYGSNNPPSAGSTGKMAGAAAIPKTGNGDIIASGGCVITEVTSPSTVIPANSTVIFIPASFEQTYDVTGLCTSGAIYVVYININGGPNTQWSSNGTLANSASGNRYIQIANGTNACTSNIRTYTNAWASNNDGNAVWWNASGTPTYNNDGCSIITPPQPTVSFTANTPVSVCVGVTTVNMSFTTIGNPDKYSITWDATALAAGFTNISNAVLPASPLVINIPPGTPAGSYTGSIVAVNSTNNVSSTAQNITINITAPPAASIAYNAGPYCATGMAAVSLTGTSGGTYSSTPGISLNNATGAVDLAASTPGIYTVTYTVGPSGCNTTATDNIEIKPLPAASINYPGNPFCATGTATVNQTGTTGGSYSSTAGLVINATTGTIDLAASGPGTYTVTYSFSNGSCNNTATTSVTINSAVTLSPITGNNQVCVGGSTTLTNATPGGTWASNNTSVAVISPGGVVTGVSVGNVTISYTVSTTCGMAVETFNMNVNTLPVVNATTGSNILCVGATTALTNTTPGGAWSSSNTVVATVNSGGVVAALAVGSATINYAVSNACGTATQPFNITVNTIPALAEITGNANVCSGATITLNNLTPGGIWSSDNTTIAAISSTGVVTGVATGTATIRYAVTNSCGTADKTFNVSVNEPPVVADITGPNTVIIGSTIQLSNATPGGIWNSTNTAVATVSSSGTVTGVAIGTSTIQYTVTNSCGSTIKSYVVTVTGYPDDLFIPNFFTPNNDGRNDFFQVYGSMIQQLELRVYSQWGGLVFETKDVNGRWDGFYKSKPQPVGVYVYTAKVVLQNGTIIKKTGSVNLIR